MSNRTYSFINYGSTRSTQCGLKTAYVYVSDCVVCMCTCINVCVCMCMYVWFSLVAELRRFSKRTHCMLLVLLLLYYYVTESVCVLFLSIIILLYVLL